MHGLNSDKDGEGKVGGVRWAFFRRNSFPLSVTHFLAKRVPGLVVVCPPEVVHIVKVVCEKAAVTSQNGPREVVCIELSGDDCAG